jgi:Kef-type K+ transport system membrane component KefB
MPAVHFTNLLIVVAAGLVAPLALGFFPRLRIPAIVLEIVLGIVIGPSLLGWVEPDLPVSVLALVGLAFLLFLAGLEFLLSLFFSGNRSTGTAGTLILLVGFGAVVLLVGLAISGFERSMRLGRVLRSLQDTSAEIRVRAAFVLLVGFTALADSVGVETILGAFAAGALLALIDRDEAMTHPEFRVKLAAVGFGVFIPIFFVSSGVRFDLGALFASASTVARVPLFLLAIYLARGLPALVYVRLLGRYRSVIAGVLQSTSLTFIVAATQIGLGLGVVSRASAAGLVAAGLLSVAISPTLALALLHRGQPRDVAPGDSPSPVMPVVTAKDRLLPRGEHVRAGAG